MNVRSIQGGEVYTIELTPAQADLLIEQIEDLPAKRCGKLLLQILHTLSAARRMKAATIRANSFEHRTKAYQQEAAS